LVEPAAKAGCHTGIHANPNRNAYAYVHPDAHADAYTHAGFWVGGTAPVLGSGRFRRGAEAELIEGDAGGDGDVERFFLPDHG
jgi:hypothetical protein